VRKLSSHAADGFAAFASTQPLDILPRVLNITGALALTLALQAVPAPPAPGASDPLPADKPIVEIVQNLGRDLRKLPSLDTLVIMSSGAIVGAIVHNNLDDRVADWVAEQEASSSTAFWRGFGNGWTQGGIAVGTYGIGLLAHDRPAVHVGSDLIRAQVLNAVLTRSMKLIADRQRPSGGPDSMPSGHTSATFATAAVLQQHFGWKVGAPMMAMASLVGWSRVRDEQHWVSDVVIGAAVGLISGRTVAEGHRGRAWAVVPAATSRSAAIYLVRTAR